MLYTIVVRWITGTIICTCRLFSRWKAPSSTRMLLYDLPSYSWPSYVYKGRISSYVCRCELVFRALLTCNPAVGEVRRYMRVQIDGYTYKHLQFHETDDVGRSSSPCCSLLPALRETSSFRSIVDDILLHVPHCPVCINVCILWIPRIRPMS